MSRNLPEESRNDTVENLRSELKARDSYYNEGCRGRETSLDEWSDKDVIEEFIKQQEGHGHGYR